MSKGYPPRDKAGIAIVLLMAGLAAGTLAGYRSVLRQETDRSDLITLDSQRFEGLRAILGPRGLVGYLDDTGGRPGSPRAYYLTQYSLAPVVVAADAAHELVVANFSTASSIHAVAAANGLTVVHDFNNGVALLKRTAK